MRAWKLLRVRISLGRLTWLQTFVQVCHPGWSWAVGRDWLIPGAATCATLFLGAALGGVPAVLAGSWTDPQTRITAWAMVALAVVGVLMLLATWLIWHGRNSILHRNGTAYIIRESARGWSADDSKAFAAVLKRQFARMITVPGPGQLGAAWDWPLDEEAANWDQKVTELVRAFQALRSDDDPGIPKGIFIWAWAPVGIAFGQRVIAADRGLVLDVWQRPSRGRSGDVEAADWSQRPHRFGQAQVPVPITAVLPGSVVGEYRWPARLIVRPLAPSADRAPKGTTAFRADPVILLVRFGSQAWGPLPDASARPHPARSLTITLESAVEFTPAGTFRTDIYELRVLPPDGRPVFPWTAYPALVCHAAGWIRQRSAALGDHPILIGTVLPPEVALGVGVAAGKLTGSPWPAHLWPIVARPASGGLVVPRLDLGTGRAG